MRKVFRCRSCCSGVLLGNERSTFDGRPAKLERQTVVIPSSARSQWLCVRTVVGREDYARQSIELLGHECYIPKYEKIISHARQRRVVQRAFFPGYLFAAAGHTLGVAGAINRTCGVLAVVGGPHGEMRVPEQLIGELRARENTSGFIEMSAHSFRPGQKVRIIAGPCAGVTAMFAESSDERRATILIDLLGKSHAVSVSCSALDIVI